MNPEDILFWSFAVIFGVITALIAAKKGRNPLGWFIFGTALALLAIPMVLILPAVKEKW